MFVRRMCTLGAVVASLLFDASRASAAVPPLLSTTKPWVLDYDDAQCLAARDYGSPEDPISLIIRPGPNAETYEFLIGRRRSGPFLVEELKGSVDFGHGPISAWVLLYSGKTKMSVQQFRISAADMEQARSAASVTFVVKGSQDVALTLNNMSELIKGMQDCAADLKRYWNQGGEKDGRIAVPATGDVRVVFTDRDYPDEAMRRQQEGTAQFFLMLDEKGKVAACHLLQASGSPVLDAMGCAVIRERAKFKPARDKDGKPVRSTYVTPPITWRIAS